MALGANDFLTVSSYEVEIDNVKLGTFTDVRGIGLDIQDLVGTTHEGRQTKNTPGICNARDLTMVRSFRADKSLYNWLMEVRTQGDKNKRTGSVQLKDAEGKQVARFDFDGAWIKSWGGPELSKRPHGNATLEETVVLSVHDIKWS
jgi:phage tail-like protein